MSNSHNPHDERVLPFYPTRFICVFVCESILYLRDPTKSKGPFVFELFKRLYIYEKIG